MGVHLVMCGRLCRRMSVSIEERGGERRAADFGQHSYRLQVIWRYSSKLNNIRSVALGLVSSDAHLVTYIPARARTHTQHTQLSLSLTLSLSLSVCTRTPVCIGTARTMCERYKKVSKQ